MTAQLPDNEINKELRSRLHNMEIGTYMFKFHVSRATSTRDKFYFLVSTQLNTKQSNKCGNGWINSTEIQVVVIFPKNTGSKNIMNLAANEAIQELEDFTLPSATGLKVNLVDLSIDNELVEETKSEVVYRKIIRMETSIT